MTLVVQALRRIYSVLFSQDGMMALPPADAANMFYNDVERERSRLWTALLKPQSIG